MPLDMLAELPDHAYCLIHYEFNAFVEIPKPKSQRSIYNLPQ